MLAVEAEIVLSHGQFPGPGSLDLEFPTFANSDWLLCDSPNFFSWLRWQNCQLLTCVTKFTISMICCRYMHMRPQSHFVLKGIHVRQLQQIKLVLLDMYVEWSDHGCLPTQVNKR